ncbi:hypothetical protein [Rathayibacter oskolensis]|uniref:hypothetical protein n=1 Tax=Rathayibacter oskolensis TaxID=1891671 RepID=UPI003F5D4F9E
MNDSAAAASSTRWRVSARTWSRPLSALEAVAIETPASRATSVSVIVPLGLRAAMTASGPTALLARQCRSWHRSAENRKSTENLHLLDE